MLKVVIDFFAIKKVVIDVGNASERTQQQDIPDNIYRTQVACGAPELLSSFNV